MHRHIRGVENLTGEDGITLELCAGIIDKPEKSIAQHAVEGQSCKSDENRN